MLSPFGFALNSTLYRPRWIRRAPQMIAAQVLRAPFFAQKMILIRALNRLLKKPLSSGDFNFLIGKWLEISCDDPSVKWYFTCSPQGTLTMADRASADVSISGSFDGFLKLAAQRVDPDTLFFQRELLIEGDTELGLELKNLFDRVDLFEWPPEMLFTIRSTLDWVESFDHLDSHA